MTDYEFTRALDAWERKMENIFNEEEEEEEEKAYISIGVRLTAREEELLRIKAWEEFYEK